LGQSATPAVIEDTRRHLERLDAGIGALEREAAGGERGHDEKLEELRALREQARGVLVQGEERLAREIALAAQIHALRERMRSAPSRPPAGQPVAEAFEAAEALESVGGGAPADPQGTAESLAGGADPDGTPGSKEAGGSQAQRASNQAELDRLLAELREVQGEAPMVPLQVDGTVVA